MAVYHYMLDLLPRAAFGNLMPSKLSEEEIDLGQDEVNGWWALHPPSDELISALRTLLPINKSWAETEEYTSSTEWESDLRIWKTSGRVWHIAFRYSPLATGWDLMVEFLEIAKAHSCLLHELPSGLIFEPAEPVIRKHFEESRAAKFLQSPESVIIQAAEETKKLSEE